MSEEDHGAGSEPASTHRVTVELQELGRKIDNLNQRFRVLVAWLGTALIVVMVPLFFNGSSVESPTSFHSGSQSLAIGPAVRFDQPATLTCRLNAWLSRSDRVLAIRDLLERLSSLDGINAVGVYETGRVTVAVDYSGLDWVADFQIAWPQPTLEDRDLYSVKLVNWTIAGDLSVIRDATTVTGARTKAVSQLRGAIAALTRPDAPLHEVIQLLPPSQGRPDVATRGGGQ